MWIYDVALDLRNLSYFSLVSSTNSLQMWGYFHLIILNNTHARARTQ